MSRPSWLDPKRSEVNLFIKYLLFFFNFAIFLVSGVVVGLMTWILILKEKKVKNTFDFFLDPACDLCLAGCIGFVVAFFGWFGALRENIFALKIYRWILTILFFLEMALVILIFIIVYVPDVRQQLNLYPEDSLKEAIVKYRDDDDMQDLIDGIQQELECCGTTNDDLGYKDWSQNAYFNCSTGENTKGWGEYCSVPFSCCIKSETGLQNLLCGKDMQSDSMDEATRKSTIHTRGCFKAITSLLEGNVLVVGGIIIGIFLPQIFLTAISGTLIGQIQMQMAKWRNSRPS